MIRYVHQHIVPAAYALLPREMRSVEATALMLAIGLQESRFEHRRQIAGPARGLFQFEHGGLKGVLVHPSTKVYARAALEQLQYPRTAWSPTAVLAAIEHNDILACVCARLLLWTLPDPLPDDQDVAGGWTQYVKAWRPGHPRPERWETNYRAAWRIVT